MTPQQKLNAILPQIRWHLKDQPKGYRVHIYDLLRRFNLISNLGYPSVDPTSLAVKLGAFSDTFRVEHTDAAGPFRHIIERI